MEITQVDVQKTLNEEDIEGLRKLGAPADEYSHEAKEIASRLSLLAQNEMTEEKLVDMLRGVWVHSFGPFSDEDIEKRSPAFRQVAHRILGSHP